jgi:hypothetical protein
MLWVVLVTWVVTILGLLSPLPQQQSALAGFYSGVLLYIRLFTVFANSSCCCICGGTHP